MNSKKVLAAAVLALAIAGCTKFSLRADGLPDDSVYFTALPGTASPHIQESDTASWLFWGLVPLHSPVPADKLRQYLDSKRRIGNFTVTTQNTFWDGFLGVITLGIYTSRTIMYEGDVVQ